jgi:hypothetical protein
MFAITLIELEMAHASDKDTCVLTHTWFLRHAACEQPPINFNRRFARVRTSNTDDDRRRFVAQLIDRFCCGAVEVVQGAAIAGATGSIVLITRL